MIFQKNSKILREKAKEVNLDELDSTNIKNILTRMETAMNESSTGVAIAAPQIGESLRIFMIDGIIYAGQPRYKNKAENGEKEQEEKFPPAVFVNPVIKKISKKTNLLDEGCLSVDGVFGKIKRAEKLTVEAFNEKGEKFSRNCSGFIAQIVQHETDHLNGILFIDKATDLHKAKE